MLDINSNEENDLTKISDSSKNESMNSNDLTITTKTQRDENQRIHWFFMYQYVHTMAT